MKSPTDSPNVDCWIVDCWYDIFIEGQLCIHWLRRQCQVNHWILNTRSGIGVQSIFISDEVTNRFAKCWQLFSWLLWRCLYWERSLRKSCLYLHFILFEVIIILIISHNNFIICYYFRKRWFACFLNLNYPTHFIISSVFLFTNCNSMFVTHHPTDLTSGKLISWIFIDVTSHMESSCIGPLLTWHIVCASSVRKKLLASMTESHL